MYLQRSKTIAQICKSKQELRGKRLEANFVETIDGKESELHEAKEVVQPHMQQNGGNANVVNLGDDEEHSYSKGKQVNVLKNPADDLGIAIIGGKEHSLPIIISEVFPNSAVQRSNKIEAGDVILSVNGQDFSSVTHGEAVKFLSSLQGRISFQLLASDNVCEDDPSNLNFRFYRIFDPDISTGKPAASGDKQSKVTAHPGKAVLNAKPKLADLEGTRAKTKVDLDPLTMSPVHKKNASNTNSNPLTSSTAKTTTTSSSTLTPFRPITPTNFPPKLDGEEENAPSDTIFPPKLDGREENAPNDRNATRQDVVELREEDGSVVHV
eukprot:TRINITY_DN5913_c0_g1_i1.p1 TRINITY_DN5913_c0_g1~~TRINITY_DN5913_c0_g1_i1.p1  ORF type:complete len:324 (+),score=72.92 TRINITY_DN5913_c0_g1_i1:1-972(+)